MKTIALLLLLLMPMPSAADELKIRFIGNAAFEITDGKTTLLTDYPYEPGAFGYMTYRASDVQPVGSVACLITHRHKDHFDANRLEGTSWKVIGAKEILDLLPQDRRIPVSPDLRFGDAAISAVSTDHAGTEHYSYLVEWKGKKLYLTGDTESAAELKAQKDLDVLIITPWLLSSVKESLPPTWQIVIHHHTVSEKIDCGRCIVPKQGEILVIE